MYIRLFHGRTSPEQTLEDWGTDGPIIGPLEIDWLYGSIRLHADHCTSFVELPEKDGLIEFEGVYYGQFEILEEVADKPVIEVHTMGRKPVPLHEWEKAIELKRATLSNTQNAMSDKREILKFDRQASTPFATVNYDYEYMGGLAIKSGENVTIEAVDRSGNILPAEFECPMSSVPALIQHLIDIYEEYQSGRPHLPALKFQREQPESVISLRIQYAGADSIHNEERLFPDTEEGIANARKQAVEINGPQAEGLLPDIFAETVELWHWTRHINHYIPEKVECWDFAWPDISLEVGKAYLRRDGEIVHITAQDSTRIYEFFGASEGGDVDYYTSHGTSKMSEEGEFDIVAPYDPEKPFEPVIIHRKL